MSDANDLQIRKAWREGYASGYSLGLKVSFASIVVLTVLIHIVRYLVGY